MVSPGRHSLPAFLAGLRAAGEETRLRILALLAEGELSVSDITDILGQSQPRISRHLKLMTEAGLIERHREGAWAFFRLAASGAAAGLARELASGLDASDTVISSDRGRLEAVRAQRAASAEAYFSRLAREWDKVRSLHAPDTTVEAAIAEALGTEQLGALLDLGTGTGRMLQLFGQRARRAIGVDSSHAMLAVARANLERAGRTGVELRQGDVYALPFGRDSFDAVVVHQVLHFLDDPARAIREAAATLTPGGRLIVVDFAAHELEFLRTEHQHRRLGFARDLVAQWFADAGLDTLDIREIGSGSGAASALTISLWVGHDRRKALNDPLPEPRTNKLEVA